MNNRFQCCCKLPLAIGLIIFLLFFEVQVQAQTPKVPAQSGWTEIDSAINSRKLLREVLKKVSLRKQLALKDGDDIDLARSYYSLMLINDRLKEDSLYFRNSAFIDSLLVSPNVKPFLKNILHVMQARRLSDFKFMYLKFKRSNYETRNLAYNYAALTNSQLDSLVLAHWDSATSVPATKSVGSYDLLWLSSAPGLFLFEPDIKDIAITEKIFHEVVEGEGMDKKTDSDPNIISYSSVKFLSSMDSIAATKDADAGVFLYYRQWWNRYNLDLEKQAYIESCMRKYYYSRNEKDSTITQNYQTYLKQQTGSKYQMLRAATTFQLFNFYLNEGQKYDNRFEAIYSGYYKKAMELYELRKADLNAYNGFRENMPVLLKTIRGQQLEVSMKSIHVPNAPILVQTKYQNVPVLHYRIVKVGSLEHLPKSSSESYQYLYKKTPVLSDTIKLPDPADYNVHATYLKLQPLPAGTYYLLFSAGKPGKNNRTAAVSFAVSDIAPVNTENQFFVLNRSTGQPLKQVRVSVNYPAYKEAGKLIQGSKANYFSNQQGLVSLLKRKSDQILLIYGKDTLIHHLDNEAPEVVRGVFDKSEYDDLEDFYEDQAKMIVYTDRGIYRPGQKVHFKAILCSRNPITGEQIIFNKDAGKAYQSWLKKKHPKLTLVDASSRTLDSLIMTPDDFGSFSGTFIIPKTAITGQWNIESDVVEGFYNGGSFSVEEYKRPTFEMTLQEPAVPPIPGTPFELKLKVNSLAGANLGNLQIKYRIERSNENPKIVSGYRRYSDPATKILDSTGFTNEQGELSIQVTDTLLQLQNFNPDRAWHFNYQLIAVATENSGEQVELEKTYSISNWPWSVVLKMQSFYEKENLPLIHPLVSVNEQEIKAGPLKMEIYEIRRADSLVGEGIVDQWRYSPDELRKWFPEHEFKSISSETEKKKLIFSELLDGNNDKFALSRANLSEGEYELVITAKKEGQVMGRSTNRFRVFDQQGSHRQPVKFSYLAANMAKSGDSVLHCLNLPDSTYLLYGLTYYARDAYGTKVKTVSTSRFEKGGLLKHQLKIPEEAVEKLVVNYAYVHHNEIYTERAEIRIYKPLLASPEIIVEKYRKVMEPGARERFSVSIKTGNKNIVAQLMTTIYDAALDKLGSHNWEPPRDEDGLGYLRTNWSSSISDITEERIKQYRSPQGLEADPTGYIEIGRGYRGLAGFAPEESVVRREAMTGSVIQVRDKTSVLAFKQPLVIVDGLVYEGDLKDFDQVSITEGMVVKGADAAALYGARAASGVLILSTKGKIVLPGMVEQPVVKVRKNFNETAVFIPKIYADKDGLYTFSFTMPESATSWNWKMLAHTKDGLFVCADRKLNTRLNLMLQAHMPRLLYQGDELNLQSRLTNMDSLLLEGKVRCSIEDAVTGEDLTRVMDIASENLFSLAGKKNGYSAFKLKVPEAQLNPLKIVLTVIAGSSSDAEEHIVPVMSRQVFVKQSTQIKFSAKDTLIQMMKLPEDARLYGLGLSVQPKPEAAVVNALSWLANYSYDCAEQTFNKMFAHITALTMMQKNKDIRKLFDAAKHLDQVNDSTRKKITEFPEDIVKVVNPWLSLDAQQTLQQAQLLNLLDTVKTKVKINKYLEQLYAMQNPDGGMPWFKEGVSNTYISNYLLAGFGKLKANSWEVDQEEYHGQFIKKLLRFCDSNERSEPGFYDAYAKSFWHQSLSSASLSNLKSALNTFYRSAEQQSLKSRLLMFLSVRRLISKNDALYAKAKSDLESIRQLAIKDTLHGVRWKEIADQDDLQTNTEEMIGLLADAFSEDLEIGKGLLQWLMSSREDQHWRTTTGTAAAVHLLMKSNWQPFASAQNLTALSGHDKLSVSDDLLNGRLMDFRQQATATGAVSLSKTGITPANGNLTRYYFTGAQNLASLNAGVKLEKKLHVFSEAQQKWVVAEKDFVFKVGMQVKVVLHIESPKPLTFLQLSDYRSAAFEPLEQKSGQQYQDKISFYQSIRDTGYQIFTEFLPSGKSELSYLLKVVQEGTFTNGPAVLSCLYKPEIAAYSNAFMIRSVK